MNKQRRRQPPPSGDLPLRVAAYARTSTEDQAERDTIKAQTDFLTGHCELYRLPMAGLYVDDGISGAARLDERPAGQRLLDDARDGRFSVVLVYRLDRLGRSLAALQDAHDRLDALGVAIRSGTEPFDTSSPFGRAMFQFLGVMAELERSTIAERMARGRNRVALGGKYTGGPIPLGYDLDEGGCLVPSERPMAALGMTEAEYVRDYFRRIADREATHLGEAARLLRLGVPRVVRYGGGRGREMTYATWQHGMLARIVRSSIYVGTWRVESQYGPVERPVPPLVDDDLWRRAQAATEANRTLSRKNATATYLLRGLLRCGSCGRAYVGMKQRGAAHGPSYRCSGGMGLAVPPDGRCRAGSIDATRLEAEVWARVRAVLDDPEGYVAEIERQLQRDTPAPDAARVASLRARLAEKTAERDRVRELARRGAITLDEAERDLAAIAGETDEIRRFLASIEMRDADREAHGAYLRNVRVLLEDARRRCAEIEATDDQSAKRALIETVVARVVLESERVGGGPLRGRSRVTPHIELSGVLAAR
jgi:site-specific DNA recombinase